MNCALVGSRFFGASMFEALPKEEGIVFTSVVAPAADDRLADRRFKRHFSCSRAATPCNRLLVAEQARAAA